MLTRRVRGTKLFRGSGLRSLMVWLCCVAWVMKLSAVAQSNSSQSNAFAPNAAVPNASLSKKIAAELETIHAAKQGQLSQQQVGVLWGRVGMDYQNETDFVRAEDAYGRSLLILGAIPAATADYAVALTNIGTFYLFTRRLDEAETCLKKALVQQQKLGDVQATARTEEMVAEVSLLRHRFKDAEREAEDVLRVLDADPPSTNRFDVVSTLVTLVYARCLQKDCSEGEKDAERAVMLAVKDCEPSSLLSGQALLAQGFAKEKMGKVKEAEPLMLQGIKIIEARLPASDPRVAGALWQYRNFLAAMHRNTEAKVVEQQVAALHSQHPSCNGCTVSVAALSGMSHTR